MSDQSELSTPYTVDSWLNDADVIRSVCDKVEEEIEFPELEGAIKKRDKIDADDALKDMELNERKRIKASTIQAINRLRESDDVIKDFTVLLERFRKGPQNTKPKGPMLDLGEILTSADEFIGTRNYFRTGYS